MGPAKPFRDRKPVRAHDPLLAPSFDGRGDPKEWAQRVAKWNVIHDKLCEGNHRQGLPKSVRGAVLSEVLEGPVRTTIANSLTAEELSSDDGVAKIIRMLVKFNPVTYAQEISAAHKNLSAVKRADKETYTSYVNRFEAAASQLEALAGYSAGGEAEQHLTFQLLEGASLPHSVYMQPLSSCVVEEDEGSKEKSQAFKLQKVMEKTVQLTSRIDSGIARAPADYFSEEPVFSPAHKDAVQQARSNELASIRADLREIQEALPEHKIPIAAAGIEGYGAVSVSIESAKKAIRALDAAKTLYPQGTQGSSIGQADFDEAVRRSMKKSMFGSQSGSKKPSPSKDGPPKKKKTRRQKIEERKKKTRCNACGKVGHWAGDKICEMHGKDAKNQEDDSTEEEESGSFFA